VFFGANPANDQPVTMKYLHEARRLGTRIVLVNPYLEPGMRRYWFGTPESALVFRSLTGGSRCDKGDIAFSTRAQGPHRT
jgi:hypothetical protein